MKKIKNFWLLAMPLAFIACQNETLEDVLQTSSKNFTLLCTVEDASVTRAQVEIGNEDRTCEKFMWNDNDQITVFDKANLTQGKTFTIASCDLNDNPTNTANFTNGEVIADGTAIAAVYPPVDDPGSYGDVVLLELPDYDTAAVNDEAWREYFKSRMFMYASGVVNGSGTELTFNQLTAMARVTYINGTSEELIVPQIILEGTGSYFGSYSKLNLKTGVNSVGPDRDHVSVMFDGDKVLQSGESCDVYMLFFPGSSFNENTNFYVRGNGNLCTPALPGSTILAANEGATGFEAGKRYWFTVAQTDEGLIWAKQGPKIDNMELIAAIEEAQGIQFTKTADNQVDVLVNRSLIDGIHELSLNAKNLTDVTGIEYFTSLDKLYLASNNLTSVDVSKTHVRDLSVENNNELTELVLNQELEILNCSSTALQGLHLSGCPNLTTLKAWKNRLKGLDLWECPNMQMIEVYGGLLTKLVLGAQPSLVKLDASGNALETLNLSGAEHLQNLNIVNNVLTSLDVSCCSELLSIQAGNNHLSNLTLDNSQLQTLQLEYNQLTELDLTKCPNLSNVNVVSNMLISLKLNNPNLQGLYCGLNCLTDLDITSCTALKNFDGGNQVVNEEHVSCRVKVTAEQEDSFSQSWDEYLVPYMDGETPDEEGE